MNTGLIWMFAGATVLISMITLSGTQDRIRTRDLGVEPGVFQPGPLNAISDVAGVRVGHTTIIQGNNIRTGVTAIVPHEGNLFQDKVAGAVYVGNAFGKLAGSTQVNELGTIETPIILTNTLSVGTAVEATVAYMLRLDGNEEVRSVNALVGETNDGGLNDIRGQHVKPHHIWEAIDTASGGTISEGSVGAGTGTRAFGWKGGIGTSSRQLPDRFGGYTVGVLVQSNYGGVLTIDGVPIGKELQRYSYAPPVADQSNDSGSGPFDNLGDGSCMLVVATDAPVDARDLKRIATRAVFGLARTGSSYSNGSGDFAIAFSTSQEMRSTFGERNPRKRSILQPDGVSPLFQATLEATEEAVYNSMLQATTITGNGRTAEALPIDQVRRILEQYGRGQ